MPFTISHAAAVLPLERYTRARIPLAAMMIGSMAPDFGYFLPISMSRASTHDLDGLFLFCWPAGLAVWLLFVHVLERPTIELLPAAWRERVAHSDTRFKFKPLALASLGILIGALTHIAWDAFTHGNTVVAQTFPLLRAELFEYRGHTLRLFRLLQYLSSVVGLLALAWWAWNLRKAPRVETGSTRNFLTDRARIGAVLVVFVTSGTTALLAFAESAGSRFEHRLFELLIGGMTGWLLAWCVVAVIVSQVAQRAAVTTMKR